MATKRIITSNIWEDEFFGSLSMFERLLWIGLFSRCADDQGRLVDNPIVIRSQVFPYDDLQAKEINAALEHFAAEGKIIRYTSGAKHLIQIVKWWENQSPQWAMPSCHPAPEGWLDRVRSYIKGVYYIQNWPEKPKKQATEDTPTVTPDVVSPGGNATLPPQVAGHEINPILNPEYKEINAADAAPAIPEKPPKPKRIPQTHPERDAIIKHFLIKSGLPAPRTKTDTEIKAAQKLWWSPADEILQLAGGDVDTGYRIVDKAYAKLRDVTVTDLNSIIKTARAVYAELGRNGHGVEEFAEEHS